MQSGRIKSLLNSVKATSLMGDFDLSKEQTERLQTNQLDSLEELTTIIVMAGLLNTFVIMLMFGAGSLGNLFTLWAVSQCAVMGYIVIARVRQSQKKSSESPDDRIRRYVRGATIMGFFWAIIPLMAFPVADDIQFVATGIILTATLFGAVMLFGRVPDAAMGFVLPILGGMLAALQLQQDPRNGLLSILTLVYGGMLYFGARLAYSQFARQQLGQEALEEQTQVIGLLLRDFEENATDSLWQTDPQGLLSPMPDVFSAGVEGSIWSDRVGQEFTSEFLSSEASNELIGHFRAKRPFRDVHLQLKSDPKKWYSVTGKPVFDRGVFEGYRGVVSDVTKAKEIEERISFMAHHDELTGLPNRNRFTEILNTHARAASNDDGDWYIIWLGLDRFKWLNDTMGHPVGDKVLKSVGERLNSFISPQGATARLAGDEFAILDYARDYSELRQSIDDLLEALAEPYSIWGSTLTCRATAGVKVLPKGFFDVEKALKQADTALNEAKARERGSWCLFDHRMEDQIRAERQLETDLQRALENDELRLFFQPIVSSTTREVVACETLLRWEHPQRGLLGPHQFIEFAEENGLITHIGNWTLRKAIAEAARISEDIRVAINVSPVQIHSDDLIPTVINALATSGVSPSRIELEITESVMISDTDFTMGRLRQLKDIGVRIALDDFGTGFSSLSYLRQFPFDKLKIDKCFTECLETDEDSRAITQATLSLAKALKIRCTGEGVETPGQADFLRDNGCDELQGFMFSRPQPIEKLGHLLKLSEVDIASSDGSKIVSLSERETKKGAADQAKRTPKTA